MYTVSKLIANAYYASGIVSRDFETVSGTQENVALDFLNERIADKTIQETLIPYVQKYEFNGVIGQERYIIPNLINVSTLVFFIETVRYSMVEIDRNLYFGSSRADNINSLPYNYHVEREKGGASIYMYFKPQENYLFQLWGSFRLSSVTMNQDLTLIFDQFYIDYLRYDLANRLCVEYNFDAPPGIAMELKKYERQIGKKSAPLDLNVQKISTLGKAQIVNYAQANLGRGWTTNG